MVPNFDNPYMPNQRPTGYYPPQPQMGGMNWAENEGVANSWPVAPGTSVPIFDKTSNTFYIKTVDQSGMPAPLRIFDYTERKTNNAPTSDDAVTKKDLEELYGRIMAEINKPRNNGGYVKKHEPKEDK